jgi:DNA-binding GntR family transcriptional regulator
MKRLEPGTTAPGEAPGFQLRPLNPDGRHTTKLARSLYSGRIASSLREAIIDGQLPAQTPLVETALADQLSVSRGPIRSALHVLEGEGLVRTLPNGRCVSAGFDDAALSDLFDVRFELESLAIARGLEREASLDLVHAAMSAIEAEGASTERLVALDIDFHRTLVELSESRFLVQAWLALAPVIKAVITIGNRRLAAQEPASNFARIVDSHQRLLDALRSRSIESAEAMLAEQFELSRSMFVERSVGTDAG